MVFSTKSPMLPKNMLPISCMLKNCHYCGFALLPACHHCNSWPHPAHELCVCVCEPPISPSSAAFILLQQCYIPAISTSAPWQNFLRGSLGFMACGCWLQIAIDMLLAAVSTALQLHFQPPWKSVDVFLKCLPMCCPWENQTIVISVR